MELKKDERFYRDDYGVKILNVRQMVDSESGAEFWQTDAMILIDDMEYMRHGFRTEHKPDRNHLTAYMNILIPELLAHDTQ